MTQPAVPAVAGDLPEAPRQPRPSMRDRVPAQHHIERALQERSAAGPRSRLERWLGIDPVGADGARWYAAALAERAVAHRLAGLPSGWTAFHSLPVGRDGGCVDHLVVGPAGVFGIDVVDAREDGEAVQRAEARAAQIDRIVSGVVADAPVVRPVVVVAHAGSTPIRTRPSLAAVLRIDQLRRHLRHQPDRLAPEQVAALALRFDDDRAWQPSTEAGPELLLAFGRLAAEMRTAARVRAAWAVALLALTAVGAVAMLLPGLRLLLG